MSGLEEKVCKTTDVGTTIQNLQLNSYSKNDLITIIESSLLSYLDGSNQPIVNHLCARDNSNNCVIEVRVFMCQKIKVS